MRGEPSRSLAGPSAGAHGRTPRALLGVQQRSWLRPGWPLTGLLIGYPLWWVLGLAQILSFAAAGVMLLQLMRRRRIFAPRGFGIWLLFLAWLLIGVLVLQVNAPGTVQGGSNARYLTFAFRFGWYIAATVVLLYLGNMRKELSTERVVRAFAWMFVTVVGGGILGTVAPHLDFPSAVELALPHHVAHTPFVHDLVHPIVAQLNIVQGAENPRASAPFPYTNNWALNVALLLPFFLVAWFGPQAGWRRSLGPLVLAIAVVPVVLSGNRGLWIALVATALFVAIRSAALGRLKSLATILGGIGVVVALLLMTPLGTTVEHRLDNGYSDASRSNLSEASVFTVMVTSPVVGLGTTRDVQGSFTSIAGGETAACPLCTPPSLGTQGHLWSIVFATGAGGLLLYFGFFGALFRRAVRLRSRYATVGLVVIVAHVTTTPFYDIIGIAMFSIMAGAGLMWREHEAQLETVEHARVQERRSEPTLGGYVRLVRSHAPTIAACALIGMAAAGALELNRGPEFTGEVPILLPAEPEYPDSGQPETLDTIAQLATSSKVLDRIERETGMSATEVERALTVSATPNTRILHLTLRTSRASTSRQGAEAGASALLAERQAELERRRRVTLDELNARSSGLAKAVSTVDRAINRAPAVSNTLEPARYELFTQSNEASSEAADVASSPTEAGSILSHAHSRRVTDGWNVSLTSGLMLGVVAGIVLSLWRLSRTRRISQASNARLETGLSVLARIRPVDGRLSSEFDSHALRAVAVHAPTAFVGIGPTRDVYHVARALDRASTSRRSAGAAHQSVVLVVSGATRVREINRIRDSLKRIGVQSKGMVIVGRRFATPPNRH